MHESRPANHPVVLVVEEPEPLRQTIQSILEGASFLVLPASTATEAFQLAESCAGPIHLLITPLHLAEMTGPELASLLRERSPDMSVLYSSASPRAALEIPDPAEVVSSMLPSPFNKEILLRRVHTLIAAQEQRSHHVLSLFLFWALV
jgi:CheY-like chemotaxis protein